MNYLKKMELLVLLVCLPVVSVAASERIHEHTIQSDTLGETQRISVYLPDNYHQYPNDKYPVFYFLDGQYYKELVRGLLASYYENGLAPDMILVAIENEDRVRDYTPSVHEVYQQGGGADNFLQYIENELIPFVDKHYQTSNFRILNGHSLGGLFTLHTMHSKPGLFRAYLAMSPSLHWGNKATLKKLKNYLASADSLNQFLYVNLGDEGYQVSAKTTQTMRAAFLELQTFLDDTQPSGLRFKTELLQTIPHVGTLMIGLVHGSNELYRNWSVPFRVFEQGPEGIEKHFQLLSKDLFTEIKPRKRAVNFAAEYVTYDAGGPQKGLELLKYNAQLYPESAWVLFNLAKGFKDNQQMDKAKQHATMALQNIKADDNERLKTDIASFLAELAAEKTDK